MRTSAQAVSSDDARAGAAAAPSGSLDAGSLIKQERLRPIIVE